MPSFRTCSSPGSVCRAVSYTHLDVYKRQIIASIYAKMEATGLSEGILFIDAINCVSETLAHTMLQFLQCTTFGDVYKRQTAGCWSRWSG